jgi:hypothetical protein
MRMRSVCLPVTAATRIELEFKHLPESCLANEAVPVTDNFAKLRHAQSICFARGWQIEKQWASMRLLAAEPP